MRTEPGVLWWPRGRGYMGNVWLLCVVVWQKPIHSKVIFLQLKNKFKKWWITVFFSWNLYNIAHQLYFNFLKKKRWSKSEGQISYNTGYMWNFKKMAQIYVQNKNSVTDVENKLKVARGWSRWRINWETGIDIYTLLYTKWITNKDSLYSTENSTQYSVMTYMGKKSKKGRYMYMYNWFTLLFHSRN